MCRDEVNENGVQQLLGYSITLHYDGAHQVKHVHLHLLVMAITEEEKKKRKEKTPQQRHQKMRSICKHHWNTLYSHLGVTF